MNEFNVGDRVIYKDGGNLPVNATVSSLDGCPPGQVIISIDESGAVGMVPVSKLTKV